MNRGLWIETCVVLRRELSYLLILFLFFSASFCFASEENPAKGIVGTWQGTLHADRDLRVVVKISKAEDGAYRALFYRIDQSGDPLPVAKITLEERTVKMSVPFVGGTYEGRLAADARTIVGNVSQGANTIPLNLTRATAETEWTAPPPPPRISSMDPNARPSYESATIKVSKPDQRGGHEFRHEFHGNRLRLINVTLNDLITFAYDIHVKQVIGTPRWAGTDRFDIEIRPEGEGMPTGRQWKGMLQKLMTDRFGVAFHREMKELPVYILSVGRTGPKLTKGDRNGVPVLDFGALGTLHATNASMADFAFYMQWTVLDRPVVDQTALEGRFNFDLIWKPDESQFAGLEAKVPPVADAPPLFTAIQEQIGLNLDATRTPVEVLVIDHVESPSEN